MEEDRKLAFIYKRKSKEREDEQALSLPAQQSALERMPDFVSFETVDNIEESKTARIPEIREGFNNMVRRIMNGEANYILCWQLNRLARNPIDGGKIIWLVQNYGLKIVTPHKTFDINDILILYIEFAVSNNFILDLSKGTMRGLSQKVDMGIPPIRARIGYLNTPELKQGKRYIKEDPIRFPIGKLPTTLRSGI